MRIRKFLLLSLLLHSILLIGDTAQEQEEKAEPEIIKVQRITLDKQIVETKQNNKKPVDAKYASERDNLVEKETKSRSAPKRQQPAPQPRTKVAKLDPGKGMVPRREQHPQLFPDIGTINRIDHLEDIDDGEDTNINAVADMYASFFNRMKRELVGKWKPFEEIRLREISGKKFGVRDRKTILTVTLDSKGFVKNVYVKNRSGLGFLDDVATKAFIKCIQFPNPPSGMIKDGKITFDFGFFVEFNQKRITY